MSRSALDRLEQKKAAEAWKRQQEMIWQQHQYGHIQDDDQEKKRNELPMVGNSMSTFNLNKMLYNCIEDNEYFQKIRYALTDFQQITEEVAQRVTHVEPWSTGTSRVPSTAFCLLVRYCNLRLTTNQLHSMIRRRGAPHVRALGFLYLRLVTDHKQLWDWVEEFLDDPEQFAPSADPHRMETMGSFIKRILTVMDYHNTLLPRIAVPVERKLKALLILNEDEQRRAASNERRMRKPDGGGIAPGAKVQAIYKDEETDPAFFPATVNEVLEVAEGQRFARVVVTFDGYGNTEELALGKIQVVDAAPQGAQAAEYGQSAAGDEDGEVGDHGERWGSGGADASSSSNGHYDRRNGDGGGGDRYRKGGRSDRNYGDGRRSRSPRRDRRRSRSRSRSRDRYEGGGEEGGGSRHRRSRSRSRDGGRRREAYHDRGRDRNRSDDERDDYRGDGRRSKYHRSGSRDRGGRDRDRQAAERSPPQGSSGSAGGSLLASVMGQVLQKDQRAAGATGKDYAHRPTSYKGSLSLKQDRYTYRRKSRSRSPDRSGRNKPRGRSPPGPSQASAAEAYASGPSNNHNDEVYERSTRSDEAAAAAARSTYLKSNYGDASSSIR